MLCGLRFRQVGAIHELPLPVETGSLKPLQNHHILEMKFVYLAIISLLRQTLRVGEALPWHYDAATPTPNLWVLIWIFSLSPEGSS
jgi:hypothetical protein